MSLERVMDLVVVGTAASILWSWPLGLVGLDPHLAVVPGLGVAVAWSWCWTGGEEDRGP